MGLLIFIEMMDVLIFGAYLWVCLCWVPMGLFVLGTYGFVCVGKMSAYLMLISYIFKVFSF